MTTLEARKVYKGLYIGFLITQKKPKNFDSWTGRVLYTADTYNDHYKIPAKTDDGKYITKLYGMGVKDLPMGGTIAVRKPE